MAIGDRRYPNIRGKRMSFASVSLSMNGQVPTVAFKDISYDDTLSPVKVMGTSPIPLGRTEGTYEANASVEIYREEFDDFMKTLGALANGAGFKETSFDIVITYSENGTDVITDTLVGCRIESNPSKATQGADPLTVPVKLNVLYILWNGRNSVDTARYQ